MPSKGKRIYGTDKVFIIAEVGMNHNGSFANAIKLIDYAADIGADCVKFQLRNIKSLYSEDAINMASSDLGTEYTLNLIKKFQLTKAQYKELKKYTERKGLIFLCTPWDKESLKFLERLNLYAYKIASADLTNLDLIKEVCKTKKVILLSTGMSNEKEINNTVKFIKSKKTKLILLHTNSTYPTPIKDINLNYIDHLKSKYKIPVGYSGHERGIKYTLAAVSKGARYIERHITLDKNMEGPDHTASLDVNEFKDLIINIRDLEIALGNSKDRVITQGEMINRENLGKSIFTKKLIKTGSVITRNMLEIKSPGQGMSPQLLEKVIGKKVHRRILKGKTLFESDLRRLVKPKQNYNTKLKWGIPVRLHDVKNLLKIINPNIVEFHMSYDDIKRDIHEYLDDVHNCGFLVHAPELFKNDHLLDLCTSDKKYRDLSIRNLQSVINITEKLKEFFPKTITPYIIVNCGGFTKNSFLNINLRNELYNNLIDSLQRLDMKSTAIIPQTMAPFPWHFGGQRYQNLFMDNNEIIKFCTKANSFICHDISHSFMACMYHNWDHLEYIKKLSKYTKHYHIADAKGVDGEGLQIGEGDICFKSILSVIKKTPNASFIPEIWQGHKNDGEGFWKALKSLENHI